MHVVLLPGVKSSGKKGGGAPTSEHGVEYSVLNQDQTLEDALFADRFSTNSALAEHWCSKHDTSKVARTVENQIGSALAQTKPGDGGALVWKRRHGKGLLLAVRKAPPPPA